MLCSRVSSAEFWSSVLSDCGDNNNNIRLLKIDKPQFKHRNAKS